MREILFRGKRADDGEWVEGFCVKKTDSLYGFKSCYIVKQEALKSGAIDELTTWYLVDPETVGQYTGLRDKNGKRIFERDVLRKVIASNGEMNIGVVSYADGAFGVTSQRGAYFLAFFENSEVIGNIHDNPELIGGKEE